MLYGNRRSDRAGMTLVLISLTLFLLLLPLTLSKPGLPQVLKADEAAYYLGSLSLWHDGDFKCEDLDARRLFREYPGTANLILMSEAGGEAFYFGVPIPYPLLATPFVALFGANGMVLLNAALLIAMVWMGVDYLRRYNDPALALLFAGGFFLLSTAFVYVFWLQAEVFSMACVMAAFYLIERADEGSGSVEMRRRPPRLMWHAAGAAVLLAIVVYSKPMFVILALPLLYRLLRLGSWRAAAVFAAAGFVTSLTLAGIAYGLTEQAWPYFARRAGISLSSPIDYVERRVEPRLSRETGESAAGQLKRGGRQLQVTILSIVRRSTPEFLFGRHGGFFVYMPFAVLSILLFALNDRRSVFGWLILVATALTAAVFLAGVRGQWLGGGGFIGNRYFLTAYPAFFFLVRRVRPAWLTAVGYAAAAVFLGPLLITPLGAVVREPTLQAHVRNQPYPRLPLEWSLIDSLSGYQYVAQPGATFHGRRDEIMAHGDELWVHGAKKVELNLLSRRRKNGFVFDVRSLAPENTIEICLQDDCRRLEFGDVPPSGTKQRVTFEPRDAEPILRPGRYGAKYRHHMTVTTTWGEQPRWRGSGDERFYVGAALALLGSPTDLETDLYDVEWLTVDAPASMEAGGRVRVPVSIRNSSAGVWPSRGAARVRIAYHWLTESGDTVSWNGKRTELAADVVAGGRTEAEVVVDAPSMPGHFVLAFDLLRERIGWFSRRREGLMHEVDVEVFTPVESSLDEGSLRLEGEPPKVE